MSNYKSEFRLLLRIRSVRADRAERNLINAETKRHEADNKHNVALFEKEQARTELRELHHNRFPLKTALVSGTDLKNKANMVGRAEARLQDRSSDVNITKELRDFAEREALIAKEAYNLSQKVMLKTEAILEEIKDEVQS